MKKILIIALTLIMLVSVSACGGGSAPASAASDHPALAPSFEPTVLLFEGENVSVPGDRGHTIPAVLTLPEGSGPFPVTILVHGHAGNKDEGRAFVTLSSRLAEDGIASIRIDFPGCGDSEDDFITQYNVSNMLKDIQSAKTFVMADTRLDTSRLGIVGFSMGGRLVMLTTGVDSDFSVAVMWAPVSSRGPEGMFPVLSITERSEFDALHNTAKEEGSATYTFIAGYEFTHSRQWFDDMVELDPADAFAGFRGDVMTIYGELDWVVTPDDARFAAEAAVNANSSLLYEVQDADHLFGAFGPETDLSQSLLNRLVNRTVSFLRDNL